MNRLRSFCTQYGILVLALLHLFGLITIITWNRDYFAAFTPLNLLITSVVLILSQRTLSNRLLYFFVLSFVLGYGVELLGTQTGFPFGNYHYGENLAPLLFGVPVVIGLNWFLLAISTGFLMREFVHQVWLRVILAALFMVSLDFLIEKVAPSLGYWYWENEIIPWMNYLGWFVVSIIVQIFFIRFLKEDRNRVAAAYFPIVLVFFIILNLAL